MPDLSSTESIEVSKVFQSPHLLGFGLLFFCSLKFTSCLIRFV
jgi:hypothetical protein